MPEYKTVIISDSHIFSRDAKVKKLNEFLAAHPSETLILNGDIIDGWKIRTRDFGAETIMLGQSLIERDGNLDSIAKKIKMNPEERRFFDYVLNAARTGTRVIYLRGNHDDFLDPFVPFKIAGIQVVKEFTFESHGKRYLVIHGDVFDVVTTKLKVLAYFGDLGYSAIMWINHYYNRYRAWRGLEYYSFSKRVKQAVKSAVSFISAFEVQLTDVAKIRNCDGVICGHIHSPADKMIGDTRYLNSGDWVESLTGIVEHHDGTWEIVECYKKINFDRK